MRCMIALWLFALSTASNTTDADTAVTWENVKNHPPLVVALLVMYFSYLMVLSIAYFHDRTTKKDFERKFTFTSKERAWHGQEGGCVVCLRSLNDNCRSRHLYLSVCLRPRHDGFLSVDRVTIVFTVMLTSLCANAALYGVAMGGDSSLGAMEVVGGMMDFFVGAAASVLATLPISLLLVCLFRAKARRKEEAYLLHYSGDHHDNEAAAAEDDTPSQGQHNHKVKKGSVVPLAQVASFTAKDNERALALKRQRTQKAAWSNIGGRRDQVAWSNIGGRRDQVPTQRAHTEATKQEYTLRGASKHENEWHVGRKGWCHYVCIRRSTFALALVYCVGCTVGVVYFGLKFEENDTYSTPRFGSTDTDWLLSWGLSLVIDLMVVRPLGVCAYMVGEWGWARCCRRDETKNQENVTGAQSTMNRFVSQKNKS